jgi:hypothetical protein
MAGGFDAIEWANGARREIDAVGHANKIRGVPSIEGGVKNLEGRKPAVPPARPRPAAAPVNRIAGSPFKPGQKVKGFGNLEGLKRLNGEGPVKKGLNTPEMSQIAKYLEDPHHEVLAKGRYDERKHKRDHGKFARKNEGEQEYVRSHWAGAKTGAKAGAFIVAPWSALKGGIRGAEDAYLSGAKGKTGALMTAAGAAGGAVGGAVGGGVLGGGIGAAIGRNVPKHD